ncbi:UNVERIFIED_CONTAM: hypothetical protein FKN15_045179 [Acipenser sinensis]
MNTRCPPKRVPSATRFFAHCELTVQPPQSYSVGGQRSSGQLTGKPAGARPDYRGRWIIAKASENLMSTQGISIVFGPTLLWPQFDTGNMAVHMVYQNQIVELILIEYSEIFGPTDD